MMRDMMMDGGMMWGMGLIGLLVILVLVLAVIALVNDRDASARPLQCCGDGCAGGQYDIWVMRHNLCCVLAKQLVVGSTRSILDQCVTTVSPAEFLKCLTKCDDLHPPLRVEFIIIMKETDPSHLF